MEKTTYKKAAFYGDQNSNMRVIIKVALNKMDPKDRSNYVPGSVTNLYIFGWSVTHVKELIMQALDRRFLNPFVVTCPDCKHRQHLQLSPSCRNCGRHLK